MELRGCTVAVIGAGTMGAGIAQVASQAGHRVLLHDAREGAAGDAKAKLSKTFDGLVAKGKLEAAAARDTLQRIEPVTTLPALVDAKLVVEAIVENLDIKRKLLAELESLLAPDAVLASNTSSISITALGRDLKRPERLVGMHFFNPVPLMKLVEVVSGLRTDRAVADVVFELSKTWGKTPVHARSTPGFIVNRIARPYYAEALALLHERYATPVQIVVARTVSMLINEAADAVQQGVCVPQAADAAMKLGVNYPAGPFEWLERIGAAPVIGLLETLGRDTLSERYRVSGWLRHRSGIGTMGRA